MALINLNDTTPPPPSGVTNCKWQADALAPRNVSVYMPLMVGDGDPSSPLAPPESGAVPAPVVGDAAAGKFLKADGTWEAPPAPPLVRYERTLLVKDATVGNDIADHVTVFSDGTATRVVGLLRLAISADLTVRFNLVRAGVSSALITCTIPLATAINTPVTFTGFSVTALLDGDVLTPDITAGSGQRDIKGIASFCLEWRR